MGEATAVQKSRLDAERQALKARVAGFRRKMAEDKEQLGDEVQRLVGRESPMAEHPRATVAASAAAGFIASMAPLRVPKPHIAPPAPVKKAASKGAGVGLDAVKVEATMVLKDFVDGVFNRSNGQSSHSPASNGRYEGSAAG